VGAGEESGEAGEPLDADAADPDDAWPALPELDLDVCLSDWVPGADLTDRDANDAPAE
jgi:hypothetical protein